LQVKKLYIISSLFLIIFFISHLSYSQSDLSYRYYFNEFNADSTNQNKLHFRLENNNFFKNNEYFSPLFDGYTLLGYNIAPMLVYYVDSRFRLQAGFNLLQYHGLNTKAEIKPVVSAYLRLFPNFDLIMGNLRGNVHHKMIEPMFDPELQFTQPTETGFQFLYNVNRFSADIWLDWEQFILQEDSIPEMFTAGISSNAILLDFENGWKLNFPVQFIAKHIGGQIGNRAVPVQTHTNIAAGVDISKQISGFFENFGFFGYYLLYNETTSSNFIGIRNGNAVYAGTNINMKNCLFMLGYWGAENFYAPKGCPIFQSVSHPKHDNIIKEKNLFTGKIAFHRQFKSYLKFSLAVETYYDLNDRRLDHSSTMNILFTPYFY